MKIEEYSGRLVLSERLQGSNLTGILAVQLEELGSVTIGGLESKPYGGGKSAT